MTSDMLSFTTFRSFLEQLLSLAEAHGPGIDGLGPGNEGTALVECVGRMSRSPGSTFAQWAMGLRGTGGSWLESFWVRWASATTNLDALDFDGFVAAWEFAADGLEDALVRDVALGLGEAGWPIADQALSLADAFDQFAERAISEVGRDGPSPDPKLVALVFVADALAGFCAEGDTEDDAEWDIDRSIQVTVTIDGVDAPDLLELRLSAFGQPRMIESGDGIVCSISVEDAGPVVEALIAGYACRGWEIRSRG